MAKVNASTSGSAQKKSVSGKVKQATKSRLAVGKDSVALKKQDTKSAGTGDLKSKRKSAADLMEEGATKPNKTASAGAEPKLKSALKGKTVAASAVDKTLSAAATASKTAANTKKNEKVQVPTVKEGKAATKGKAAVASSADQMDVDAGSDDEDDDDDFVHGFSSSEDEGEDAAEVEDDSDDSDDDEDLEAAEKKRSVDVPSLPSKATDDKSVKRRLDAAKRKNEKERGVLYLGRIPHGFYEDEMKQYFKQFGDVTRLRLARNKKTGASKHFAYIEFAQKSVAEITAETMHNYLLLGHLLQCHVVPAEKLHPDLWVGANRKWRKVPTLRIERATYGKPRTQEQSDKADRKLVERDQERKRKIKDLGIDYDYEGFSKKK